MRNAAKFVVSIASPLVVGGLSGLATARGVEAWYPTLAKPSFNPPGWVFGPVWTVLYILMGVAAFLVWKKGLEVEGVKRALGFFVLQLGLNGLWSVLFFGLQMPGWALVEIVLLWAAIVLALRAFWRVSPVAGWLLAPYLAWVSFAMVLNGALWMLNS